MRSVISPPSSATVSTKRESVRAGDTFGPAASGPFRATGLGGFPPKCVNWSVLIGDDIAGVGRCILPSPKTRTPSVAFEVAWPREN
jgi:hypothetical protein